MQPFFMHREIRPLSYLVLAAGSDQGSVDTEVYLGLLKTFPGVGGSTLSILEKQLPFGGFVDFFALTAGLDLPKVLRDRIRDLQLNIDAFRINVPAKGLAASLRESMAYLRVNTKSDEARRFLELAGDA